MEDVAPEYQDSNMKIMIGIAALIIALTFAYYFGVWIPQRDSKIISQQQIITATPTPIATPVPTPAPAYKSDPPGYVNGVPLPPPQQALPIVQPQPYYPPVAP